MVVVVMFVVYVWCECDLSVGLFWAEFVGWTFLRGGCPGEGVWLLFA